MKKDQHSANSPRLCLKLRSAQDAYSLNYSSLDEFRTDSHSFIKTLLQNHKQLEIIEFMENYIPKFFQKYEDLMLCLYKIHFIDMIRTANSCDKIDEFYLNNLKPIILKKKNSKESLYCLLRIKENPEYVQTRTYQPIWLECCDLFTTSVQKAIHELYTPNELMPFDVISQENYKRYQLNKEKLNTIEFDIMNMIYNPEDIHMHDLNQFDTYTNGHDDNKSFINFESKEPFPENDMMIIDDNESSYSPSAQSSMNNVTNRSTSLVQIYDNDYFSISQSESQRVSIQVKGSNDIHHISTTQQKSKTRHTQPSIRKEKKIELKAFQFKFTKRENIDKKILRSFKKYIKKQYKKHDEEVCLLVNNSQFWKDFLFENLFPNFTYEEENTTFHSFNTKYMFWVFKHPNAKELYAIYLNSNAESIYNDFILKNSLTEKNEELPVLKNYINTLAIVFSDPLPKNSNVTKATSDYLFDGYPIEKQNNENDHFNILRITIEEENDQPNKYSYFSMNSPKTSNDFFNMESSPFQEYDHNNLNNSYEYCYNEKESN